MCESMPSCQGQGEFTPSKQEGLGSVLHQWLNIMGSIKSKALSGKYTPSMSNIISNPVLYVDMNAGCGWNHEVDCPGSPLIFLDARKNHDFSMSCYFIEKDLAAWQELSQRLGPKKHWATRDGMQLTPPDPDHLFWTYNTDHEEIVPILVNQNMSYGLLYHDPNSNPNFDLFRRITTSPKSRFVDILIRISGTAYKRQSKGVTNFGLKNGHDHLIGKYPSLREQLKSIKKREWIIREIEQGDKHQWTFLLGTNWTDFKAWESKGFFNIKSVKGTEILNKVTYTKKELEDLDESE